VTAYAADALVLLGLLVLTAAVIGMVRFQRFDIQIHAAAKAVFLGLVPLLAAAMLHGDVATITRAVCILAFLALTTPVSSHALARTAWRRERPRADGRPAEKR
jgi:multicomponent Na+:H+ antiporter subunit G